MELNDGYKGREWRKPVSECVLEEQGRRMNEVCLEEEDTMKEKD